MGLEHIKTPPVTQGESENFCWAACLSWWLKAVFNRDHDMNDIIGYYENWVNWEDGDNYGALSSKGIYKLIHDQRWHLFHDEMKNDKITFSYLENILKRGPVIVAYYEPAVKGFHMNVIVAGAGLGDVASGLVVMDPNFYNFQIRSLSYYKKYYSSIYFIYKASLGSGVTYAYE